MALKQLYEFLRLLQGDWEGSSLSGAAQHTQAKEQREAMEFYMAFAFRKKEAQPGSKGRRLNVLKGIFVTIVVARVATWFDYTVPILVLGVIVAKSL